VASSESDVKFVDEREREIFAVAMMGEKAVAFFRNDPVGQYLHHRAKVMIQEAQIDAIDLDPDGWRGWFFTRRKLRKLRQQRDLARLFINWLADAIVDGRNAEKELTDYRNPQD
jgi:hypothetical protein